MATTSPTLDSPEQKRIAAEQLGRLIELYKHHFDLFLKGVAGLLAVIGFVGAAVVNTSTQMFDKLILIGLMSFAALLGIMGGVVSMQWVRLMRRRIENLCAELHLEAPPLVQAQRIVTLMIVMCSVLFLCAVGYAVALFWL